MLSSSNTPEVSSNRPRVWYSLFGILVLLTGVLFYVLVSQPAANSTGVVHAKFATMKVGGSADRHQGQIAWLGLAFAVLQYAFLITSLLLGLSRMKPAANWIAVIGSVCMAACITLFALYNGNSDAGAEMVLGFPGSTAWMLYVLWPLPILFIVMYCLKFDDWFYTLEDRQRFEQLLASRSESELG